MIIRVSYYFVFIRYIEVKISSDNIIKCIILQWPWDDLYTAIKRRPSWRL